MPPVIRPPSDVEEFSAAFREGIARLRYSRAEIGHRVRVSARTVSRWNMGDLLPHPNQRARLLAELAPAGADVVARVRRAFGMAEPEPPAPAPPAPPVVVEPPRDVHALRKDVELALHAAAERLDRSPRATRVAVVALLATLDAIGVSAGEARAWLGEKKGAFDADDAPPTRAVASHER